MSVEAIQNIEKHIEEGVGLSMQEIENMSFREVEKHICKKNGIKKIMPSSITLIDGARFDPNFTIENTIKEFRKK